MSEEEKKANICSILPKEIIKRYLFETNLFRFSQSSSKNWWRFCRRKTKLISVPFMITKTICNDVNGRLFDSFFANEFCFCFFIFCRWASTLETIEIEYAKRFKHFMRNNQFIGEEVIHNNKKVYWIEKENQKSCFHAQSPQN